VLQARGTDKHKNERKNMTKQILRIILFAVLSSVVLQGCAMKQPIVKIDFYPSNEKADVNQKVVLKLSGIREDSKNPWQFEWQANEEPIPGATNAVLIFEHVELTNAAAYRCRIYRVFPQEEFFTDVINLGVTTKRTIEMLEIAAPSSGPLQTGTAPSSPRSCGPYCTPMSKPAAWVMFAPPGSSSSYAWWGPAMNSVNCTATDISQSILFRSKYVAQVEVMETWQTNNTSCFANYCGSTGTNSTVTFPVTAGHYYQFALLVQTLDTSPALKKGQSLQVNITGGW
jgi:hypothetical protein